MYVKKITLFVILSTCLFLVTTAASGTNLPQPETSVVNHIYFQDNFSRPDAEALGTPWVEGNEHEESDKIGSMFLGPGYLELNNATLAYHYKNHPQKTRSNQANNWRPYTYVPFSESIPQFPIQMTFTFMLNADERIQHSVGLMHADDGFAELLRNEHFYYEPNTGIGVHLGRTNRNYSNSDVRVYWYDGTIRTELHSQPTSFQFEADEVYSLNASFDRQETTIKISDGLITDTFTVSTPEITFAPDQLFLTDIGGGISSITIDDGDYSIRFDDFIVTANPSTQVMLPLVLNNYCVSSVTSLDIVLLLDTSGSMETPISLNGPTKLVLAQDALVEFLNLMDMSRDQAGYVTFASKATLLHELSQDKDGLITAVQSTIAGGTSRLDLGMIAAHIEAIGLNHHSNAVPVIIMLTDGKPNGTDEASVLQAAEAAKAAGIEIYTIGFGPLVNIDLLKEIATEPDYFYNAPLSDDLSAIYQQILTTLNCQTY